MAGGDDSRAWEALKRAVQETIGVADACLGALSKQASTRGAEFGGRLLPAAAAAGQMDIGTVGSALTVAGVAWTVADAHAAVVEGRYNDAAADVLGLGASMYVGGLVSTAIAGTAAGVPVAIAAGTIAAAFAVKQLARALVEHTDLGNAVARAAKSSIEWCMGWLADKDPDGLSGGDLDAHRAVREQLPAGKMSAEELAGVKNFVAHMEARPADEVLAQIAECSQTATWMADIERGRQALRDELGLPDVTQEQRVVVTSDLAALDAAYEAQAARRVGLATDALGFAMPGVAAPEAVDEQRALIEAAAAELQRQQEHHEQVQQQRQQQVAAAAQEEQDVAHRQRAEENAKTQEEAAEAARQQQQQHARQQLRPAQLAS